MVRWLALLALSPFRFALLRKNVSRLGDSQFFDYLRRDYCDAPADEILAVASAMSKNPDRITNARSIAECVSKHKDVTDQVDKFLISIKR